MEAAARALGGTLPAPLLTTKLYLPPVRPDLIARPHLVERLQQGLWTGTRFNRKLTLLCAPAGSGKTTLLSEWLTQLGNANTGIAWLSLDGDDCDPAHFWTYVVAALRSVAPGLRDRSPGLLQVPPSPAGSGTPYAFLAPLLNELAALQSPVILALDDYHLILNPAIHDALAYFLEHQPPTIHLAISTRADPPLPIFRIRARGQLVELRSRDLRFSAGEAGRFLNALMGLDLAPGQIAALEARTEGWIVGLQLAALALQGSRAGQQRPNTDAFLAQFTGSHQYVLEYLTGEVVDRQPEPLRQFLIQTSVLDRFCGPLCDAVVRTAGAGPSTPDSARDRALPAGQHLLVELARQNLFTIPLDAERRWYRYHHLFADLLQNLLRRESGPEAVRGLHRRASAWFAENDLPGEAIRHALRAEEFERAAALVEAAAQPALSHGQVATLLGWIDGLPGSILDAHPRLRLFQGWALHLGCDSEAAERVLLETRRVLDGQPDSPGNRILRGQLAALLTGIATLQSDTGLVLREAGEALALLPRDDAISRARVYVAQGTAYAYRNQPERAEETWRQAHDLALEAGNPFLATAAIELLAGTYIQHEGRLREAAGTLQEAIDRGTPPGGDPEPFTGTAHALLAEVYLEWNDLERAAALLETGIDLQQRGGISYGLMPSYCTQARLHRAMGNARGVRRALQSAEATIGSRPICHLLVHQVACQACHRLWLGDLEAAARWAETDLRALGCEPPPDTPQPQLEMLLIARARIQLARGEAAAALETLSGVAEGSQAAGRKARALEACLVNAQANRRLSNHTAAVPWLEQALSLAESEGYVRLFLEAGDDIRSMIRELRSSLAQRPPGGSRKRLLVYADALLAAWESGARAASPPFAIRTPAHRPSPDSAGTAAPHPPTGGATPRLLDPLTPRERDVLHLICQGYSNQQIAGQLVVSLNTVKKHSSHVYSKLGVNSRAQAIIRARELELC